MTQFLDSVASNPIIGLVSLLVGIVGVVLAVIFFIKSRREKSIYYAVRSFNFINDAAAALPNLEVSYDGIPVPRLTATKVAIWNGGTETIRNTDLTEVDPLRISLSPQSAVLSCSTLAEAAPANRFALGTNSNSERPITIKFDFIDPKQGLVVMVLHTGDALTKISLEGTVKGCSHIQVSTDHPPFFRSVIGWSILSAMVAMLVELGISLYTVLATVVILFLLNRYLAPWLEGSDKPPQTLSPFLDPFSDITKKHLAPNAN
ncbi:MAG: hypothetical protein HYZ01_03450 [Ignavibacteriales bacterium]|nr:hypothetical protein [Ignavibacteriales bacterium]